jgi:hypothetical protein
MFGRSNQGPANPVQVVKDPSGAPAVPLEQVAGHPVLKEAAEKVGVSLRKRGLAGMRGRVVVLLDHSGSMSGDYRSGLVQSLLVRTLGFGLQIDTDATVEVVPFDTRIWPTVNVTTGNYETVVRNSIWQPHDMGYTNLAGALRSRTRTSRRR